MTLTLLERVKANAGVKEVVDLPVPKWDPDLIPDADPEGHRPDPLDEVLDGLDILDAYNKWCGKMTPNPGNRRESIKVSCPNPAHPDSDPSAWVNLDKQTWYCGGCAEGGDTYDIAAWHFGFDVPGYKNKDQFPELRKAMAADLGVSVMTTPTGKTVSYFSEDTGEILGSDRNKPEHGLTEVASPTPENVIAFPAPAKDDEPPSIDWRSILAPGTFLYNYMEDTDRFDLPSEFHFWCGIQLLGAAAGKMVCLDSVPDIYPNFYICLLGPSGLGKSRAAGMARSLLEKALPYNFDDPDNTGTHLTPMPGSGESLLDIFSAPEHDPEDGKRVVRYCSVRGLVSFAEFSTLAAKASRSGNTLKTALIELYDGQDVSQKSRTSGLIVVKEPFCQVIATTQPRVIKDVMTAADADSGFVNRWIIATGPSRKLSAYYTDTFDPTPHVAPLQRLRIWCGSKRHMHLSGAALARWEEFFYAEIEPTKMSSDELPLLTRCDLTLFKLILAFAINDKAVQPELRHVENAIALWPYLKASYGILSKEIGLGENDACANAVLENILRHVQQYGKAPTVSDLHRIYLKRRFSREMILRALYHLVSLEEIEELTPPEGTKGRPATRYGIRAAS